jgi:hypothetical protein
MNFSRTAALKGQVQSRKTTPMRRRRAPEDRADAASRAFAVACALGEVSERTAVKFADLLQAIIDEGEPPERNA